MSLEMGEVHNPDKVVVDQDILNTNNINNDTAEMGSERGCSRFKRICVFGGSSSGKKDCYQDAAVDLGKELVCSIIVAGDMKYRYKYAL